VFARESFQATRMFSPFASNKDAFPRLCATRMFPPVVFNIHPTFRVRSLLVSTQASMCAQAMEIRSQKQEIIVDPSDENCVKEISTESSKNRALKMD
jgi:hypothetical protein